MQPQRRDHDLDGFDGVARRSELMAAGWTKREVDAQIAGRRWARLNEAVVVLHNGQLTPEQRSLAVWLSAQAPSALCGLTATTRFGLRGHATDVVHILVPHGGRVLPTPGVERKVHESRRFGNEDVWFRRRPAYVSVERGLVDAAAWSRRPLDASRLFCAAVQQKITDSSRLRAELDRAGRIRHLAVLRRLLCDLDAGAQALSEVEFLRFCRRHRLPKPELNVRVDSRGRRRYLDAKLIGPTGRIVMVEIDGGVHLVVGQRWRDYRRDNRLLLMARSYFGTRAWPSTATTRKPWRRFARPWGLVRATARPDVLWC